MPFLFSLHAVLVVREAVERRERQRLESIHHDIILLEEEIAKNRELSLLSQQRREQELSRGIPGVQLEAYYEEARKLGEHRQVLESKLGDLRTAQAEQLKIYQSARRQREVLEDIKERQFQAYRRTQLQKEQKTLDDVFLSRRK